MRSLGSSDGLPVSDDLKVTLCSDWRQSPISDHNKLILDYVEKITSTPAAIDSDYIDSLRREGFDDLLLHDIVQVAAYFNYVNRLADGLGVELEE